MCVCLCVSTQLSDRVYVFVYSVNIRQGDDIESHLRLDGACVRACASWIRVFGQMRRHRTLTLILLIRSTPPCLSEEVCVLMEVHYCCQGGARLNRHKVLCYFPPAVAFRRREKVEE